MFSPFLSAIVLFLPGSRQKSVRSLPVFTGKTSEEIKESRMQEILFCIKEL